MLVIFDLFCQRVILYPPSLPFIIRGFVVVRDTLSSEDFCIQLQVFQHYSVGFQDGFELKHAKPRVLYVDTESPICGKPVRFQIGSFSREAVARGRQFGLEVAYLSRSDG